VVVFTPPPLFFEGPRLPPQEAPPVPEIPQPPPPVPPPAPLPKKEDPKNPKKEDDPFAGLPRPPAARSNEADEHDRQVRQGEEAFKAFEYGRAAQCFRKAIQLRPNKPLPHFLLVQSLIALAKYHEAHDALIEGLALHPTWPTMAFRPIEMYDDPVEYSEHLGAVEATLGRWKKRRRRSSLPERPQSRCPALGDRVLHPRLAAGRDALTAESGRLLRSQGCCC
jgi:tetratricopeptide (TPR) repeat protein